MAFVFPLQDKPGTPGAKARSTTPNNAGTPKLVAPPPAPAAGYPPSPYQRPADPYQRPPPNNNNNDPAYGARPPMPYDPNPHMRANGGPLPLLMNSGKP